MVEDPVADGVDNQVDEQIAACLNLEAPQSFFLFAGAGSGKTRSLVKALQHVQSHLSEKLRVRGQRVGVITFTNAASDEIKRRLQFDTLIDVRTIHSFSWSLIEGLNHDIRQWLQVKLVADIAELHEKEAKGRASKASDDRKVKIEFNTKRLESLPSIKRFIYSPTSDNRSRDSLNHAEVLKLTAAFLISKPAMKSIFVGRYPILLIDESQDTNKDLMDALFAVQAELQGKFTLGLLGDMMQRIYNDGKDGLGDDLPADWATPGKQLNHRCPKRIITLLNKIRSSGPDKQQQKPRSTAPEGVVRLFILPSDQTDKPAAEQRIAEIMSTTTVDNQWTDQDQVKFLTLEHRMAAARMGCSDMFVPLYEIESWRTSFLEGKLPAATFFSHQILPLVKARRAGDRFAVARLLKQYSPLLTAAALREAASKQQLKVVEGAVDTLMALWENDADPSLLTILRSVATTKLLEIPEVLAAFASEVKADEIESEEPLPDSQSKRVQAIETFLSAPYSQLHAFTEYLAGRARFDTHQGVKGLEFDRVMVIMDDAEARGFLFKYEDLFGGRLDASKTVEATRRLFYVTCSRAKQSLALVAYTSDPDRVKKFVMAQSWFSRDEIIVGLPD